MTIIQNIAPAIGGMVQIEKDQAFIRLTLLSAPDHPNDVRSKASARLTPKEAVHIAINLMEAAQAHVELSANVTYTNGPAVEKKQLPFAKRGAIVEAGEHFEDDV